LSRINSTLLREAGEGMEEGRQGRTTEEEKGGEGTYF